MGLFNMRALDHCLHHGATVTFAGKAHGGRVFVEARGSPERPSVWSRWLGLLSVRACGPGARPFTVTYLESSHSRALGRVRRPFLGRRFFRAGRGSASRSPFPGHWAVLP